MSQFKPGDSVTYHRRGYVSWAEGEDLPAIVRHDAKPTRAGFARYVIEVAGPRGARRITVMALNLTRRTEATP